MLVIRSECLFAMHANEPLPYLRKPTNQVIRYKGKAVLTAEERGLLYVTSTHYYYRAASSMHFQCACHSKTPPETNTTDI